MAKAKNKTTETDASVDEFLNRVENEQKRADAYKVLEMMRAATGDDPKMWGPSIVGFGNIVYRSPAGREGDWPKIGFSPRKSDLTLYVLNGSPKQEPLLEKLGKHSRGKSCLYIKRLSEVDEKILEKLIASALRKKGEL